MGCFGKQPLALLTPTMRACHRCVGAGFIDKNEACKVEIGLAGRPDLAGQRHVRPILLRRIDRFF